MGCEDAIGVVRKHRWASVDVQRQRLQEDGCRVIVDLDSTPRDWLCTAIRERTIIKLAYACLLTPRRGVRAGLEDYNRFASKIMRLPRACHGYVKDLDTGLVATTAGTHKAMLSVVREQLMRSSRGLAISEAAKRGRRALELTPLQKAQGEAIWFNLKKYRTRVDAEVALQDKVHENLTHWAANRLWGPRQFGAKPNAR
jgi:hypothetical protein